jgi:RNA polymerase sigma factor (sigma-70 family)
MSEGPDEPKTTICAGDLAGAALEPYWGDLCEHIRSKARNADEAGDIAQSTYLRIHSIKDKNLVIEKPKGFLRWLAKLTHADFVRAKIRERERLVSINDVDELVETIFVDSRERYPGDDLEERTHYMGELEKVEKAMKRVPVSERTALILVERDGLTPKQAAQQLGISESSVKTYIKRARAKLRIYLYSGEAYDKG